MNMLIEADGSMTPNSAQVKGKATIYNDGESNTASFSAKKSGPNDDFSAEVN